MSRLEIFSLPNRGKKRPLVLTTLTLRSSPSNSGALAWEWKGFRREVEGAERAALSAKLLSGGSPIPWVHQQLREKR